VQTKILGINFNISALVKQNLTALPYAVNRIKSILTKQIKKVVLKSMENYLFIY